MNARTESASFHVSRDRGTPRGAEWAVEIALGAGRLLSALAAPIRKGMQASSQARARAELLKLADAYERTQPAFAAELRAASAFDTRE